MSLAAKDLFLTFIHHSIPPFFTDGINQDWGDDGFGHTQAVTLHPPQ